MAKFERIHRASKVWYLLWLGYLDYPKESNIPVSKATNTKLPKKYSVGSKRCVEKSVASLTCGMELRHNLYISEINNK